MRDPVDDRPKSDSKPNLRSVLHPAGTAAPPQPFVDEAVSSLFQQLPARAGNGDEHVWKFVSETVSTALIARDIPRKDLCLPRMDVVIPALDAARYSPIKDAFASLIASSMDNRTAHRVLPAYVEMLKQLSEDELVLLRDSPKVGRFTPIADIVYVLANDQVVSVYRNVLPPAVAGACTHKDNIPQYVDNLVRLNLLYRPTTQEAADTSYRSLSRLGFVRDLMRAAPPRAKAGLEKSVIGLSDLGDKFLRACLV